MRIGLVNAALLFLMSSFYFGNAFAYSPSEIISEAQSSFLRGDLFNAYRFYEFALSEASDKLEPIDVENYVLATYHLSSNEELKKVCQEKSKKLLKDDFNFYCGKVFLHAGDYVTSLEFLEKVPKSLHRLEYHFIKGSAYLKLNKSEQCLGEMKFANTKVTKQTSTRFKEVISVLQARCFLGQGLYGKALARFQDLNPRGDFYLATLEEQAWAHFKMRNLIASREIMNILVNYFTSRASIQTIFGADVYFRTRYLQGYVELITQNADKSKQIFTSLNAEVKSYRDSVFGQIKIPKTLISQLRNVQAYLDLQDPKFSVLKQYRDFMEQWDDQLNVSEFDRNMKLLISLNIESKNLVSNTNPELKNYRISIAKLQERQSKLVVFNIQNYLVNSQRGLDSILFKASMGQVENIWAERTEGKRTLAEVLDTYKSEVNQVEGYLAK